MRGFLRNPRLSPISNSSGGSVGRIIIRSARDVITVRARPREFVSFFPHMEGEAGPPWEATFRDRYSEHCK